MLSENVVTGDALQKLIEIFHGVSWWQEPRLELKLLFDFTCKSVIDYKEFVFFGFRRDSGLLSVGSLGENVSSLGEYLLSVTSSHVLCEFLPFLLEVIPFLLSTLEHLLSCLFFILIFIWD